MAVLFVTLLAVAAIGVFGAPQQAFEPVSATSDVTPVPIISQSESNNVDGSFNYRF